MFAAKCFALPVVAATLLVSGRAEADFVIDQSNLAKASIGFGFGTGTQDNSPVGQTFTPTLNAIDFAIFYFANFTRSSLTADVSIFAGIRTGIDGVPLAVSVIASIPPGPITGISSDNPVAFNFATSVALTPGASYTLMVNLLTSGNQEADLICSAGVYDGGEAIIQGIPDPGHDAIFSEGVGVPTVSVPEPWSFALTVVGLSQGVFMLVRRRTAAGQLQAGR